MTQFQITKIIFYFSIFLEHIYCEKTTTISPIDKRDQVLAHLFNYGDPEYEYPSIIKLTKACNMKWQDGLREMIVDLLEVIESHYNNEIVYNTAKHMFNGPLIPDEECKKVNGPNSRAGANTIKELNARRFDAKDYRDFLELVLSEATKHNSEYDLSLIACYLKLWTEKTIEKYPAKNGVQKKVKENIHKTFDKVIEYLQEVGKDKIEDCDFMNLPKNTANLRFKSIQMNLLEAIDNLTHKSR